MRVLLTSCPNYGHFFPMAPLAWALRNQGHEILAAVPAMMTGTVAAAGIPAASIGDVLLQEPGEHDSQSTGTAALVEHVLGHYVPQAERTADRVVEIARDWGADLIVSPSWEYAGPLAAGVLGIPWVFHAWGVVPPAEIDAAVAEALAPLHRRYGLTGGTDAPLRWIDVCPPALAAAPDLPGALPMRYIPYNGSVVVPDWLLERPERPRVCVTLGNIPILGDHENVMTRVMDALDRFDVEVVVGAATALKLDGDLGPRTRIARGLPLSQLLPSCDAVIHHGGAGSAMATLVAGLPALVLPQMCVQYQHAEQIEAAGAGIGLIPAQATADGIAAAMAALLDPLSPSRAAAQLLGADIAARPHPDEVATTLAEAVAAHRATTPYAASRTK